MYFRKKLEFIGLLKGKQIRKGFKSNKWILKKQFYTYKGRMVIINQKHLIELFL